MAYRISKEQQAELEYRRTETKNRCSNCDKVEYDHISVYYCHKISKRVPSDFTCKHYAPKVKAPKKPGTKRIIKGLENELKCTRDGEVYYYRISDRGNRILIFNTKYNKLNFLFGLSREAFYESFEKV